MLGNSLWHWKLLSLIPEVCERLKVSDLKLRMPKFHTLAYIDNATSELMAEWFSTSMKHIQRPRCILSAAMNILIAQLTMDAVLSENILNL